VFQPGCIPEKRTGQDSQKKSQSGSISPMWGEPPLYQLEPKFAWWVASQHNHICKVSN